MRDECFIRGNIPMTKSEVRAVSLSKLELTPDSILYDIGAGTGSVSIEAAMIAHNGHVYAMERKEEGCALIAKNAAKFGIHNISVIAGNAPESMHGLPAPDRVFIGGSGGNMTVMLDELLNINRKLKIVFNVIALETLQSLLQYLKERDLESEIVQITVARAEQTGPYHLMKAQNPVYIITLN